MSVETLKTLEKIAQESVAEFFASITCLVPYKANAKIQEAATALPVSFASVIGYTGESMKGSMVLVCERELLDKSHPNHGMGMPVGEPEILDWVGEAANQILGRIKNKLSAGGVKFAMGTPTTVTGKSMQITAPKGGHVVSMGFVGPYGPLSIYLLTVLDAGLVISAAALAAPTAAAEGASILF